MDYYVCGMKMRSESCHFCHVYFLRRKCTKIRKKLVYYTKCKYYTIFTFSKQAFNESLEFCNGS